ncbi:MAG: cyclic nucleotide-binding domain-containing protein [Mariprofundaceae bacterium]
MSPKDTDFLDLSGVRPPTERALLNADIFPILKGMSPIHLRILNEASRVMHVSKDVEMLHEGDAPHDMYFIESGKLAIAKHVGTQLKIITQLGAGNVYGEFGALRRKSRYASAYTSEPCRIIRVELSAVQQVLEVDAAFKKHLNALLTCRMLDSFFFSHPVFQELPADTRTALAKELPIRFFERGSRIFSQGNAPTGVYLILSGEVEVRYLNKVKAEVLLEIRRDNDMIGEVVQKNGTALAYSAIAASDLDALMLDKDTMSTLHQRHPQTFAQLENYINKRSERSVKRLRENLG